MKKTIHNRGQAKLFDHPGLEILTKTKPWIIYVIYIPINISFVYYAYTIYGYSVGSIAGIFILAMFFWTLTEYLVHRSLFHFQARSKFGQRLVYIFHENHHEFPRDKMRLFMPPVPSIIIAAMLLLVCLAVSYLFSGSMGYALVFFSGFISGYLLYVSMHFAIHAYKPPKYLKPLWRNHHLHHYKYPDKAFGVSSVLWDKIFGTVPEKEIRKDRRKPF